MTDQMERVETPGTISVERDLPADLPSLSVDRTQMGQVILNLVTNALQSMDGNGGTLTLRARSEDGKVRLDFVDTGIGMSPGDLEKMFEPLFTTKARGIGLGLAVSRSLVTANGGQISATSELGKGSTVTVELPAARPEAA
jgi:signal transduction histidine kinase